MARPQKQTVDYFPHDTSASSGRTLTIIQSKFGNDGYAFWFKLLEILGSSEGHYYSFKDEVDLEYLVAKTGVSSRETAFLVLETLAKLGAIDNEMLQNQVIWCQNFVDGIADAYRDRVTPVPQRPDFLVSGTGNSVSGTGNSVSGTGNPQTKLNNSRLNNIKKEKEIYKEKEKAVSVWQGVKEGLMGELSPMNYKTWFEKTEGLGIDRGLLYVMVPGFSEKDYILKNQVSLIEKLMPSNGNGKKFIFTPVLNEENQI